MSILRLVRRLPTWVVVVVLMAWGHSMAAPLFRPLTLDTICRGGGAIVSVVKIDQDAPGGAAHQHGQCGQCMPSDASPPPFSTTPPRLVRTASVAVTLPSSPAFHQRLVPPPARGPPAV
ncbi:DUF2946 family protein [Aquabacterium olei]|uniref:DUF2946 family protein n=1 Tax=Aquabacterium olei TaxID=1296669 RepID=UPI00131EEBC9|nr:DUF2946 family protein [Aquabacterium olei]